MGFRQGLAALGDFNFVLFCKKLRNLALRKQKQGFHSSARAVNYAAVVFCILAPAFYQIGRSGVRTKVVPD